MSGAVGPVYLHPAVQASALGAVLARLGFTTVVLSAGEHQRNPCVVVTGGPARVVRATGYVYAGPDEAGQWWFWQPGLDDELVLEPVAPLSDVSLTADAVDRALTAARAVFPQAG